MEETNENAKTGTGRRPWKIVSGGQTGVDRAGLSAAVACGLPYGGWIPKGRRAEDGAVPGFYRDMKEHPSANYQARTKANVRDSDATLVMTAKTPLSRGTQLTVDTARKFGRPFKIVDLRDAGAAAQIRDWMHRLEETVRPGDPSALVLNVAGPRESKSPGVFEAAKGTLVAAFAEFASAAGAHVLRRGSDRKTDRTEEAGSGRLAADPGVPYDAAAPSPTSFPAREDGEGPSARGTAGQ